MIQTLKNFIHLIGSLLAVIYFRFPGRNIFVIGVTGTSGKTTTVHLLYEVLKKAGKKVAMVSTVEAVINGKSIDTGFHVTTPSSWTLQRMMKTAVDQNCKYFIFEVSSHALNQFRTFGCNIRMSIITNITHEHIDYHKTFHNYRDTKAKILSDKSFNILNRDDNNFDYLQKRTKGKIYTYGLDPKSDFSQESLQLQTNLYGIFNIYNSLVAYAAANVLGVDDKKIKQTIVEFKTVQGRMEEIPTKEKFRVFIDFASKPDAMKQALITFKSLCKHKLIVVFGSAGLRDRQKRPMMGEVAATYADFSILTAEDPRMEDVRDIINDIVPGFQLKKVREKNKKDKDIFTSQKLEKYFWRIPDRQEAINFAIQKIATAGDVVVVCGKGHEKSMCYGKTEYPWDEKKAVMKALYGTVKKTASV